MSVVAASLDPRWMKAAQSVARHCRAVPPKHLVGDIVDNKVMVAVETFDAK